jgi:hypothetical protein
VSVARFIADQRTRYRVPHTVVCALLGVSLAWFYKWAARAAGPGAANGLHTDRDRRRDTVDGPSPWRSGEVIAAECSAHDYTDPGNRGSRGTTRPLVTRRSTRWSPTRGGCWTGSPPTPTAREPPTLRVTRRRRRWRLLALVAGQDVEWVADPERPKGGSWRIARRVAADRVISVIDPDTRHTHKTVHRRQDGFKAHVAIEPDTGVVTDCTLTKAAGADNHDAVVGVRLLADEEPGLEVLGDSAYGTGDARAALAEAGHTVVIKPAPLRPAVPGGFTIDECTVDKQAGTVTCPAG